MKESTIVAIIETYINGNFKDFITAMRKISKKDMLHLIEVAHGQYSIKRHALIATLQNIL